MEKWMVLGLGQDPEHLTASKGKEVLKKDKVMSRDTGESSKKPRLE